MGMHVFHISSLPIQVGGEQFIDRKSNHFKFRTIVSYLEIHYINDTIKHRESLNSKKQILTNILHSYIKTINDQMLEFKYLQTLSQFVAIYNNYFPVLQS